MTQIKPRYKLILHLSDSSTLIETLLESEWKTIKECIAAYNVEHLCFNLPSGKSIFVRHIMYYDLIDYEDQPYKIIPVDEDEIKNSYVGSN